MEIRERPWQVLALGGTSDTQAPIPSLEEGGSTYRIGYYLCLR